MTPTRGEIKVRIEIERLQRIAHGTKAPLCGVQWIERGTPLVIPTRLLKMALSHPRIAGASVAVYSNNNGTRTVPSEIEIRGKGFCYRLRHQKDAWLNRGQLAKWARTASKLQQWQAATPEGKEIVRQAKRLHEARERLRIETKRHGVGKPQHPLRRPEPRGRSYQDREWWNERARIERRTKQIQRTTGFIAARFLNERGREWQAELKVALRERGLEIRTGYSKLKRLQSGRWINAQYGNEIETYLKALWRDVKGMEHTYYWDRSGVDLVMACRVWRDTDLLKYLEWKQRERMLLQDIGDLEMGMHVEQAEGASDGDTI